MTAGQQRCLQELRRSIEALGHALTPAMLDETTAFYTAWHDATPPDDVEIVRDVTYGAHERHRLDVFLSRPAQADTAVLFVHGGGFVTGDKRKAGSPFYDNIGIWAARNGFVGATMNYRLAPAWSWPAGADDICAAVERLAKHRLHGVRHVILFGQSAGAAHVATAIALHERKLSDCGVCGAVLLSGVYDLSIAQPNAISKAYYGEDTGLYSERSSQPALLSSEIPLLVGMAQFDPAHFQRQGIGLVTAIMAARKTLPPIVHLLGHNHLSGVLHLGLPEDQLGLAIKEFATGLKSRIERDVLKSS